MIEYHVINSLMNLKEKYGALSPGFIVFIETPEASGHFIRGNVVVMYKVWKMWPADCCVP